MTIFRFQLNSDLLKVVIAIVSAHGVTDFDSVWWIVVYPLFWAIPDCIVTPAFFTLSVVHFADDLGILGSVVLHLFILLSVVSKREQMAFKVVAFFIGLVHVPLHYSRCIYNRRYTALAIAAMSTYGSVVFSQTRKFETLVFNGLMQRVVSAHVFVESLLKHR